MMSSVSNSTNISSSQQSSSDDSNQIISTGYLKDHFNVSFFDCKCCCDASKEISKSPNGSLEFLRDIQEYIHLPEYRLNCRCSCDNNTTPMKFGINLTPANDLK